MTEAYWKDHDILRTFYLSPKMDEQLRLVAFWQERMKGEIIREALEAYLSQRPIPGVPERIDLRNYGSFKDLPEDDSDDAPSDPDFEPEQDVGC